ncbi:MAG: winged helix-turn-helix domain-containing protein [Colwellia sp.]|nr:winged helix-turn-helix domain-containing protein [Colwellia sp.]
MQNKIRIGDQVVCWQSSCVINEQGEHKLEPLALAFLKFLSEHQGQVVSRTQLLQAVWHNREVSDDAIRRVVRMLRTALGDDAKSPRYIKTLPLQGYMLLPAVIAFDEVTTTNKATAIKKSLPSYSSLVWVIGFMLVLVIIATLFFWQQSTQQKNTTLSPKVAKLTHLAGAQAQGNFCHVNNTLIFVHRSNRNTPSALYSKNLTTKTVKRLTFTDDNVVFARFSPDCQQLAYTIQQAEGKATYLASYTQQGLTNVISLTNDNDLNDNQSSTFLSWSADGKSLYFSTKRLAENNSSAISAEINNSAVISRYILQGKNWQQVTFSLVEGAGDYLAQESLDGRYLAVLRNSVGGRFSILVLDLDTQAIAVERHLSFRPKKLVWLSDDSESLALSGVKGLFFYYNILHDELREQTGNKITLKDVAYHCGDKCFFMRKYDMNFTDIKEVPNPFLPDIKLATIHIESTGADFNPVYSADGDTIYFTKSRENDGELIRRTSNGDEDSLFRFGSRQSIHDLQIGPNEKYATGKLDRRVFVLELKTKAIQFITSQQEQAFFPLFDQMGKHLYFSRIEQDKVVLQKYHLENQTITTADKGFYARFENKYNEIYLVSSEYMLYKQLSDGSLTFIVQLGRNPYHSWQVFEHYVYFTTDKGSDVEIHRIDINTGKTQKKILFQNSNRFHFRLHPSGNKMLVVESLLSNSELVKVTWQ